MSTQAVPKVAEKQTMKHKKKQRTAKNVEKKVLSEVKVEALEQKKEAKLKNAKESLKNYKPIQVPKQLQAGSILNLVEKDDDAKPAVETTVDRKAQKKMRKKQKKLDAKQALEAENKTVNNDKHKSVNNNKKQSFKDTKQSFKDKKQSFTDKKQSFKDKKQSFTESGDNGQQSSADGNFKAKFEKKRKLSPAYYEAAQLLSKLAQKKGSLNSLIGECKNQNQIKLIYRLVIKVLQNQILIRKICSQFEISTLNKHLVEILICDFLLGNPSFFKFRKVPEIDFVSQNDAEIKKHFEGFKDKVEKTYPSQPVRYFRINQIKSTIDKVINSLKDDVELSQIAYDKKELNFEGFKKLALELKENQFMVDYHFEDIFLVLDQTTAMLKNTELFKTNCISIQDKSSILAVQAMDLKPKMKILDACAAPGMKSIVIASRLNNDCELFSNDMDNNRYKDMRRFLNNSGVNCATLLHSDFTQLKPEDYPDLDVLLLDPSCTGSGMNRRIDYVNENEDKAAKEENEKKRSSKLAGFQYKLLEKALTFKPKRIVYSTCSKYQMENEDVVEKIYLNYPELEYDVVDAFPGWPFRGTGSANWAELCVRADLDNTLTGGFFCAVLQRKEGVDPNVSAVLEASMNVSTTVEKEEVNGVQDEEENTGPVGQEATEEDGEENDEDFSEDEEPLKRPSKSPAKVTPSPAKNVTPSQTRNVTPSQAKNVTPSPAKNVTPKRKSEENQQSSAKRSKITPLKQETVSPPKPQIAAPTPKGKPAKAKETPKQSTENVLSTPERVPKYSPKLTRSRVKTQPKKEIVVAETPTKKGRALGKSLATQLESVAETPTRTLRTRSRA